MASAFPSIHTHTHAPSLSLLWRWRAEGPRGEVRYPLATWSQGSSQGLGALPEDASPPASNGEQSWTSCGWSKQSAVLQDRKPHRSFESGLVGHLWQPLEIFLATPRQVALPWDGSDEKILQGKDASKTSLWPAGNLVFNSIPQYKWGVFPLSFPGNPGRIIV